MKGINRCIYLGGTLDDALGEAFDKIAKALGLEFPGGPALEKIALEGDENAFSFPKPLLNKKETNLDLSFSGLKSHIMNLINSNKNNLFSNNYISDIAASFQKLLLKY